MSCLTKLVEKGAFEALGPETELLEHDIVEHTRTRKDGTKFRLYYRVWHMPTGRVAASRGDRYKFLGWRVSPKTVGELYAYADELTDYTFAKCDNEGKFTGRLSSGVTNIYRHI